MNSNWSYSPETLNSDQNRRFFCLAWPWNLMDYLEKQEGTSSILCRALCIISKPWKNSNWSYSPEKLNSRQNRYFLSCVTLKFDGWPWKTIGHLRYAASSLVHHFIIISEFNKVELQSGNAQLGDFIAPRDLEIWHMTVKNNRAPLLWHFKLCASFGSHWWIQAGVTVRKCLIWVKNDDIF